MRPKLSPCSFGNTDGSECHKSSYTYGKKYLKPVEVLPLVSQDLLHRRTGIHFDKYAKICSHHEAVLLTKFEFLQKKCINPFGKTSHTVRNGLRPITIAKSDALKEVTGRNFLPGEKLCTSCRKELGEKQINNIVYEGESSCSMDVTEAQDRANVSLETLGQSPLKIQKVSTRDCTGYIKGKVLKAAEGIAETLHVAAGLKRVEDQSKDEALCRGCKDLEILVRELKAKLMISNHGNQIQILTLAPSSWSNNRVSEEFGVSLRMVKRARKLKMEKGILATPSPKDGKKLDNVVREKVLHFFEDDEYTRLCAGKKDYISVKINDEKVQKQKRLLLCNLRELFRAYCDKNGKELGFSKFCELRPKWCVTVGSAGMHSVCGFMIHQNLKLMLAAISIKIDYKELIGKAVCNIESKHCMLQHCEQCPGKDRLESYLLDVLDNYDSQQLIECKQWVHIDRDTLKTYCLTFEDYIEEVVSKTAFITSHHFIAKHQSTYLKSLKETLAHNEVIIIMDFAENYAFIVQDAVQGYHWDNTQATIHPFVIYYNVGQLKSISVCMISDCLRHDTVAVHAFIMKLIDWLKIKITEMKHIHYFSDGSTAQYKNFKNFINLCFHEEEFGITAEWNFFGTGHGKSPCDGIGGTVKRLTSYASLQRSVHSHILTPKDMFNFCDENVEGIKFFFISKEHIEKIRANQEDRFNKGHTIAGTRESHHFKPINKGKMRVSRVSNDSASFVGTLFKTVEALTVVSISSLHPGMYVACMYDNLWWIGTVSDISVEQRDAHVNFLHPHGPSVSYHWPNVRDTCWIPEDHIITVLQVPSKASTGRQYIYSKEIQHEIEKKFNSIYKM